LFDARKKESRMYNHVLIPTDGSILSATAVENGMRFARDAGAKVTVVTVVEPFHVLTADPEQIAQSQQEYERHAKAAAARYLTEAERQAQALGVPCEVVQVDHEHPYRAIIDTAASKGCDLIAMASHGRRGVSAVLIGSETVKVLTHSSTPVLVYR
jgi:nucleotide-binding universal stress UspA family protein